MHNESLVEVKELSWQVGDKRILDNISLQLRKHHFVGLIGPNGAGKSSLMRCLYRVNRPTKGTVTFAGQDIWQCSAREHARRVAVILQEHSDQLGLQVKDVVAQGLTPHKKLFEWDNANDQARMQLLMQQVDLTELWSAPFQLLSGGEKQRVMLARAMLQNPQLLIMDEPTNHLDVHYQVDVLRQVKRLGLTVLASFHDLNLAAAYCDWLLVMDQGKLIASGTPEQVLSEQLIREVFRTSAVVDTHPLNGHPRITYAYHE